MGFFDFLFKSKPKPVPPDVLREQLFDLVARNDLAGLEQLCRQHADAIAQHFPGWRTVPEPARGDARQFERYAQGLIAVAQLFAEKLGQPGLVALLQGEPGGNPLERWKTAMLAARDEMQRLDFDKAAQHLSRELAAVRGLSGDAARQMLVITLGTLGECHFQQGNGREAEAVTREALEACRAQGDQDGVRTYLRNLYEIHRYLGEGAKAAACAEELSRHLAAAGDAVQARRFEFLARLSREGEPLNRVVAEVKGQLYELDALPSNLDGNVRFQFARNRPTLAKVTALTSRGMNLASLGQFAEAREAFERAAALDPHDPAPRYQLGVALMDQERPADAATHFQAVETLAPGWFQCRADLWMSQQIAEKKLPYEAYIMVRALESRAPPEQKVALIRQAVEQLPRLAPLYLELGKECTALGQAEDARAALDRGLACAEEPDIRTRLLVQRALLEPVRAPDRLRRLEEAVALDGNRVAAAMARVLLLNEQLRS